MIAESRFAYLEARREWPDNPDVAPGIDACMAFAAELEIRRRDPTAARAWLAQRSGPSAPLEARIQQLEAELEAERVEKARLERLAHDLDSSVNTKLRSAVGVASLMVALGLSIYVLARQTQSGVTVADTVWFAGALGAMLAGVALTFGRRLFAHAFNRRLLALFGGAVLAVFVNRWVGYLGETSIAQLLAHDCMLVVSAFMAAATFVSRWFIAAAALAAVGGIGCAVLPDHAPLLFTATTLLSALGTIVVARRQKR